MSWESIQNALTSVGNKVKDAAQKAVAPIVNAVKTTVNTVAKFVRYAYVEYDDVFDNVKYYTASWQIYNYVRGKTKDKIGPDKWDYFSIEKGEQPIIPNGAIIFYGDDKRIHHVALAFDGKMMDSSLEKSDGTPDGAYFPREQYVSMKTDSGQELYVYGYALPKN